ncbi:hypothetical protein F4678DRAFT_459849 [Xylaria arbuscula]|nr:hypothetical protein F4678DRAFT_459849 [Xylaria arbuscula]
MSLPLIIDKVVGVYGRYVAECLRQVKDLSPRDSYTPEIVVEPSDGAKTLETTINYIRRGGKLVFYGALSSVVRVSWLPSKIFEITIIGSFSGTCMFPATVDYLDSGKVKTQIIAIKTGQAEV